MTKKDVDVTAAGMRRRTARGKTRVEENKRAAHRAERAKWDAEEVASKKFGRGEKYKECRKAIREAADEGREYISFHISDFWSLGGGTVRGVSDALAAKLKKNGFKATVIWPETESHNMGDFNAPCNIDIEAGGVEVSWGPGEGHNKPKDRYGW